MVRMDPLFASWSNFFVITGSSAAALTGLMFVVLTLIAGQERKSGMRAGLEAFTSPILVHFCAALLISAILAAPWQSVQGPAIVLSLAGAYGVIYAVRVMARLSRFRGPSGYAADADDWMWYGILPLTAYLAVFSGALSLQSHGGDAAFALAGACLFLIFIAIRNAWDTVTFISIPDDEEA